MYRRKLTETILRLAKAYQVIGITGPRQSGKTTLARECFPHLPYLSFENIDTKERALTDARGLLALYPNGAIFDEIQHCPDILSYLQQIIDEDQTPGRFVVTGSQNFALTSQISQSLAGRIGMVTLLPLTLSELNESPTWQDAVFKGGYPKLHIHNLQPFDFYASYIKTYIERDVRHIQQIDNLSDFKRFLHMCAGRTGQILNISSIAKDVGISQPTASRWLSVLEASYIIFLVPPYHNNFNKRLIKQPKLYFYDTGLATFLLGIESASQITHHYHHGALFENLICTELLKHRFNKGMLEQLYFWRDRTTHYEVDILCEWGGILNAIEVKSGQTVQTEWLKGIHQLQKLVPTTKGYVVYNGSAKGMLNNAELTPLENLENIFTS